MVKVTRAKIPDLIPERHARKKVLGVYDTLTKDILDYIDSKWFLNLKPVAKRHFSHIWGLNYYVVYSSKFKDKCHNTASMIISDEILRPYGEKYGVLR